jgi:hypothetical protein
LTVFPTIYRSIGYPHKFGQAGLGQAEFYSQAFDMIREVGWDVKFQIIPPPYPLKTGIFGSSIEGSAFKGKQYRKCDIQD